MVVSYLAAACLARFRPSMSIFFICIIAFMTLCDTAGSGSLRSSGSAVGTICHERYGLRELELRPAVQGDEFLPVQLEHRDHDRALRPGPRVSVADDLSLFRIPENSDIEIHRLLGPAVEPQEWGDFLHREWPASRESSAWLSASPAGLRRGHACRPTSGGRTGPRAGRSGRPRTGRLRASSPWRRL